MTLTLAFLWLVACEPTHAGETGNRYWSCKFEEMERHSMERRIEEDLRRLNEAPPPWQRGEQ